MRGAGYLRTGQRRVQGIDAGRNGSGLRWWSRVRLQCELEVGDSADVWTQHPRERRGRVRVVERGSKTLCDRAATGLGWLGHGLVLGQCRGGRRGRGCGLLPLSHQLGRAREGKEGRAGERTGLRG